GFVVRADPLGEKRLVHNYGHGGAGITLSWGTSKLATELGLQGHSGPVAVLGSGVVGLSTARLVQEAGFPVTIYTAALPPDTTSHIAGGQFHPFPWAGTLRYDTMYVETGRYLRQMIRDVQTAGGKIEVRKFATPADISTLPESLIFNCTGLGSRDLFNDQGLHPARGQLAILE